MRLIVYPDHKTTHSDVVRPIRFICKDIFLIFLPIHGYRLSIGKSCMDVYIGRRNMEAKKKRIKKKSANTYKETQII